MKLTVFHQDTNLTLKMDNLANPARVLSLVDGEIMLGYKKPINAFYVELTPGTVPDEVPTLTLEYFEGSDFENVPNFEDRTEGLTKSGFVTWDNTDIEEKVTTLNDLELYWYRLSTSHPAEVQVRGINLVLSNDADLLSFVPNIMSLKPSGLDSFIGFHQEARNVIVQGIRNSGKKIYGCEALVAKQVDQFDLLDIEEFRNAAKYYALHLIYENAKKSADDIYAVRSNDYRARFEDMLNSRLISIDENQNGKKDEFESNAMRNIKVIRE